MDTKNPIHLTYVATLPCETLMLAKQAINDKLQASVVFIQIKRGFLLVTLPHIDRFKFFFTHTLSNTLI